MDEMIRKFEKGTQYVNIHAAVTKEELASTETVTDDYAKLSCVKFIPASGAATRMFKSLYEFLESGERTGFTDCFFENIEKFAFYEDIKDLELKNLGDQINLVRLLLEDRLNYGNLPKALIKMHRYESGTATPIDEHIYEGKHYLNSPVKMHFTISKEHEALFNTYVEKAVGNDPIEISYSFQKKHTDTLAVDLENKPFVLDNGEILYRAGGHGALIENLNDIDADIIFIKNIDNVCHKNHVNTTIDSKKMLASIGLDIKNSVHEYVSQLMNDDYDLDEVQSFIEKKLHITIKDKLTKSLALKILNRPIRVCGVVKNQGEPGGGPFLVDNGDYIDLQICEKAEIDLGDEKALDILNHAEFFNPVDLVCFVKDYQGDKFDLRDYINTDRYFISEKTYKGRSLKALEHPGLWNGAMHYWNTIFVEVPLLTFNPVKTVNDLLREGHIE